MKSYVTASIAFATFLTLSPHLGIAQAGQSQDPNWPGTSKAVTGHREAAKMVPARVTLIDTLNAKKSKVGDTFQTKLVNTVYLENGTELHSGTVLKGSIEDDQMQQGAMSRLALRFSSATLKDGTVVPIKATIVGVYKPDTSGDYGSSDQVPNSWTDGTLAVDQIGVMSNVDLHSKIDSKNSGVFVSMTKDNVTLRSGNQILLALAAADAQ